LRCFLVLLS